MRVLVTQLRAGIIHKTGTNIMSERDASQEPVQSFSDSDLLEYISKFEEVSPSRRTPGCKSPNVSGDHDQGTDSMDTVPSAHRPDGEVTTNKQDFHSYKYEERRCDEITRTEVSCERLPNDYARLFWHSHNYGAKTVTPHFVVNILGLEEESPVASMYSTVVTSQLPPAKRCVTRSEDAEKESRTEPPQPSQSAEPLNLTTRNQEDISKEKRKTSDIKYGECDMPALSDQQVSSGRASVGAIAWRTLALYENMPMPSDERPSTID